MIRRPRYPLTLRLAWIEAELRDAATLLSMLTRDVSAMRTDQDDAAVAAVTIAGAACAGLAALGSDPRQLDDFLKAISPDGDLARAQEIAAAMLAQALLMVADSEGEAD